MKKLFTLLVISSAILLGNRQLIAQPLCQAGFQYAIGNTTPNGTSVSFYDSSFAAGQIVSWSWSFGNGTGSNLQNPVTSFMPGTYGVCLTITAVFQNQTCTSYYCDTLVIGGGFFCNPNFTFTVNQQTVQFTSTGAGNTSWFWNFGDGNTSNLANPSHTYAAPGTYSVILVVTNANGVTCTGTGTVIITGPSNCNAGFTYFIDSLGTVHFTNTSTGNFTSVSWNFGNGQTSTLQNPTYTYNAPGTYVVCLSIYNNQQTCWDTYCDTLVIQGGSGCSANFGYQIAPAGVFFSAVMQNNVAWFWDFGDGTTGTGANVSHTFAPGTYNVCLTVTTSNGITCTSCQTVTIQSNTTCTSNFALYPDTIIPHNYFLVNLATGTPPLTFLWTWGDGTSSTGPFPSHTYASGGLYTICCYVTDANGCTSNTCYPFQLLRLSGSNPVTVNVISGSTGIQTISDMAAWTVAPNPASTDANISIELKSDAVVSVSLVNITGQKTSVIKYERISAGKHTLPVDVQSVSKGIYIVELSVNGQLSRTKMIIQ
jgi:PKD repeat protein